MFYDIVIFIVRNFLRLVFGYKVLGKENEPMEGAVIICCNHSSNWDPPAVASGFKRQLTFMAKAELFNILIFGSIIKKIGAFPINRGQGDIAAVKAAISLLKQGKMLLLFPQGTRGSKDNLGKTGAVKLAFLSGAPILPVGINQKYRIWGGLKLNIGEPLYYNKADKLKEEDFERLTKELMDKIYKLSEV